MVGWIFFITRRLKIKLVSAFKVLARNGFLHSFSLLYICLALPLIMKVLPVFLKLYLRLRKIVETYYLLDRELRYWQQNKKELLRVGSEGYKVKIEELGLAQEQLELLRNTQQQLPEIVIGEIDQDGFLLSRFGPIRNVTCISEKEFLARGRFSLQVVAIIGGYVGVKKHYRGNKASFVNELKALHYLVLAGCNVPSIMEVDFDNLTLTFSYVLGIVLRERIAQRGAIIRDRDVFKHPDFVNLDQRELWIKKIQKSKSVLYDVIDAQFVEDLFNEVKNIHAEGFILHDLKYGNINIEEKSGKPYLIDFESSRHYPNLERHFFRILRDQDIESFNLHFDKENLTFERMKETIAEKEAQYQQQGAEFYAPVYFGSGLRMGKIWSVDAGYGRWHYLLKHNLPSLSGKRILDLGANNASMAMQMLRSGAREVIGIELASENIVQGNFVKAGFEWADNRQYNFRYVHANMQELPAMNLGKFDMVLALCSIYYLDDEAIVNLVQYISTITDILVLQCNIETEIGRSNPRTYEKSSIAYALKIFNNNGFPIVEVVTPYKYTRPLVLGRKKK